MGRRKRELSDERGNWAVFLHAAANFVGAQRLERVYLFRRSQIR